MKKLHIQTSLLTNRIYCGGVAKDGRSWRANKTDVTGEACGAVAEHVVANEAPVIVVLNGKPKYELSVREIT